MVNVTVNNKKKRQDKYRPREVLGVILKPEK